MRRTHDGRDAPGPQAATRTRTVRALEKSRAATARGAVGAQGRTSARGARASGRKRRGVPMAMPAPAVVGHGDGAVSRCRAPRRRAPPRRGPQIERPRRRGKRHRSAGGGVRSRADRPPPSRGIRTNSPEALLAVTGETAASSDAGRPGLPTSASQTIDTCVLPSSAARGPYPQLRRTAAMRARRARRQRLIDLGRRAGGQAVAAFRHARRSRRSAPSSLSARRAPRCRGPFHPDL